MLIPWVSKTRVRTSDVMSRKLLNFVLIPDYDNDNEDLASNLSFFLFYSFYIILFLGVVRPRS